MHCGHNSMALNLYAKLTFFISGPRGSISGEGGINRNSLYLFTAISGMRGAAAAGINQKRRKPANNNTK